VPKALNMNGAKSNSLYRLSIGAAISAAAMLTAPAMAATAPANAEVALVRPLSFIKVDDLDFGKIIPAAVAGQVTVTPAGARSSTNGIILVGNTQKPASFAGDGTFNQRVDISLGSNTINLTGPGAAMQVNTFVIGSTPTAVITTTPRRFRITSATGIFQFPVGATLNVGANQAPGVYNGTWTITLQYQ
jgi:spore coat protein U-like protein